MSESGPKVFVGIDWGDRHHAVAVVDGHRELVEEFGIDNGPAGFAELRERLRRYELAGIAIESTRNMLLVFLHQAGYPVYRVNPRMAKAWRDTECISGAKDDARDSRTLARGLVTHEERLTVSAGEDPAFRRLALLCEKECSLIDKRTALVQELQAQLKQYHPAALAFFDDWCQPIAWAFLKRFPTPSSLANARGNSLAAFFKGRKTRWHDSWTEKIRSRCGAASWPSHPDEDVYALHTQTLAGELEVLEAGLKKLRNEIEQAFKELPEAEILESLPGAGAKLAPRLASILGSSTVQNGGLQALRCHSGVAPVRKQSGKREFVVIRHMCNKHWRNVLHMYAWCSTRTSDWADAFYRYRIQKGDTHSSALRKLADKWLDIIMCMLKTGEPYDELRHIKQLQKKGSPTAQFLTETACG